MLYLSRDVEWSAIKRKCPLVQASTKLLAWVSLQHPGHEALPTHPALSARALTLPEGSSTHTPATYELWL